jgi:uncharacterized lipoprotein YddW (UPF0748 family)
MILSLILIVLCCSLNPSSATISRTKVDRCDTYNHPQYGIGQCVDQNVCPNSLYLEGLCDSKPANIKCCYSLNGTVNEEFRAVWIATVDNIDWPSSKTVAPAQQQIELINILNTVQLLNMNVVIFQVITKEIRSSF